LIPAKGAAEKGIDLGIPVAPFRPWRIKRTTLVAGSGGRAERRSLAVGRLEPLDIEEVGPILPYIEVRVAHHVLRRFAGAGICRCGRVIIGEKILVHRKQ